MVEFFDIKVPIKGNLKKGLILGLGARPTIAIVLSMIGYRDEVMPLVQKLSHGTRAFICNANGLRSFVNELRIDAILMDADNNE